MGSTLSGIAILKTVKTAPNNPKKDNGEKNTQM